MAKRSRDAITTLDDAIEYRAHRLDVFEQSHDPRSIQRARRERRLLDTLIRLREMVRA